MLDLVIDRALKAAGGVAVVGELISFAAGRLDQQVIWFIGGVAAFASHFVWSQVDKRRKAEEARRESERRARDHENDSRRRNILLDALTERYRADIRDGKPFQYGDLVHLIADRVDVPNEDVEKTEPAEAKAGQAS